MIFAILHSTHKHTWSLLYCIVLRNFQAIFISQFFKRFQFVAHLFHVVYRLATQLSLVWLGLSAVDAWSLSAVDAWIISRCVSLPYFLLSVSFFGRLCGCFRERDWCEFDIELLADIVLQWNRSLGFFFIALLLRLVWVWYRLALSWVVRSLGCFCEHIKV